MPMTSTSRIRLSALILGLLAISISIGITPNVHADEPATKGACDYEFDFPPGTKLVTVGFWFNTGSDDACTGEPICTILFPVDYGDEECSSWPGNAGENSATNFSCGENSFSYTQWTTLTCSGGEVPEGTNKTVYTDQCNPDVPDKLRSRIIDFSGCTPESSTEVPAGRISAQIEPDWVFGEGPPT